MHGLYILELKKKWKCEKHLGEHGDSGYCYVSADGTHIGLNGYRLKLWAAAWVRFFALECFLLGSLYIH
jgi:hypothetical protein